MAPVSRLQGFPTPGRSALASLVAAGILAVAWWLGGMTSASAQGYGWFGGLFGGGQIQQAPQYPGYGNGRSPRSYYAPPRRRAQKHRTRQDQEGESVDSSPAVRVKPASKPAATVFVDVFGDTFGQQLAGGLEDALADKADVGIVNAARGPSGLANDAFYDWPKTINDLLSRRTGPDHTAPAGGGTGKAGDGAAVKTSGSPKTSEARDEGPKSKSGDPNAPPRGRIDVAVMMIGTNDRQPIFKDGVKLKPGTDEWSAAYRKRVMAIAEAFERRKIPLIWVGVPIVKNDDFADDMAALNDIYRDVAARTGASYIDTWEAFGDDDGDFAAFGPDINGQTVRLRSADGVYFTKAGARKLAHFVEGQVRRDLEGRTPPPQLPTAEAPAGDVKPHAKGEGPSASLPARPEAGPIKNLSEPPAAKDGRLAETPAFIGGTVRDPLPIERTAKGDAHPPVGRADDFRWPPPGGSGTGVAP